MNLPKKKAQKGQILIIFLLVLVVGVAIVMSLASRSLTDVRTTTTSDESNRAYFAAEAGVESALKKISGTASGEKNFSLDFLDVNQTTAQVSAKQFQSLAGLYAFPSDVPKDDVVQISLLNDFNDLSSGDYAGSQLDILWGYPGAPDLTAIEISLVYLDSADAFKIAKWAIEPNSSRSTPADPNTGNNFCSEVAVIGTPAANIEAKNLEGVRKTYRHTVRVNLNNGAYVGGSGADCTNNTISDFDQGVLLRIRPLYNSVPEQIGVQPVGADLPSQGFVVESSGSTISGVTRKLRVIQPYPALPAIFDYVLFNGSGNPLQK